MTRHKNCIYPSQWIRKQIGRSITDAQGGDEIDVSQIQPNSLDLRISSSGWEMPCSLLPGSKGIQDWIRDLGGEKVDASDGVILEPGKVYLFECEEMLRLPQGVEARANPKSSTGRLDIFARTICEDATLFDAVRSSYVGKLYVEIVTRSFRVLVRRGDSLTQIRFFRGDPIIRGGALLRMLNRDLVVLDEGASVPDFGWFSEGRDSVSLSANLQIADESGIIGYKAFTSQHWVLDLASRRVSWDKFWVPIKCEPHRPLILEPEEFYILSSKEHVRIPPHACAEMSPYSPDLGEVRTHYAGFFDSGFGWNSDVGASVVMEVRCHDMPFLIEHGRPLFNVSFFNNADDPDVLYGHEGSHYQGQRLKLGKQFK